jgi:hypothetical protein
MGFIEMNKLIAVLALVIVSGCTGSTDHQVRTIDVPDYCDSKPGVIESSHCVC